MFGKSWEMIKRGMAVALSVSLLAGAMSVSSSLPTAAASTKRVEVGTKGNVTINLDGREVWQAAADAMQKAQPVTGDIADRIMAQTGSNGNPVVLEDDIYKMELPAKALKGLPTGLGMEMYISAGAEDVAEDYTAAEEGEAAAVVAEVASASDLEATGVAEKPVRDFFASSMFSLIKENDEAAPAGGAAAAGGEGYELNGSEHIYFVLSNATDQDVNYTVKLGDLEILKTKVLKSHGDTTGVIGASVSDLIGVPASTSNMVRATESDMATASNLMEEAELTDDVVAKVVRTTLKNFFIIYRSEETALGTKAMVVTTADMKFKSKDGGVFTTRGDKMVLAVRDIDKNSEEYRQAAATLQNNNVDHADFAAVDISFRKGGASEDYEPCQGQIVNVRIETKAIENFDPESMSIQHHLDDGSLETVAGTTKKTVVEISDDAAEAVNNTVAVTEDEQTEITVEKKEDENVYTFDEEANKAAMEAQLSTAGKSEFKMEVGDGETALTNDVKESGAPKKASAAQTEVKKNSVTKTISSAVDANGVKTEVQEEQGNGDIKVEDGKVVADFVVDSFSIYTIIGQEIVTVDYLSAGGNTYTVSVDLSDANIPEGAYLQVEELSADEAEEYIKEAAKAVDTKVKDLLYSKALDISIIYNNEKIQPDGNVRVEVTLQDKKKDIITEVVHFGDETEVLDSETDGKTVDFTTDGFSVFAIVGTETITTNYITAEGDTYEVTVTYGKDAEIPDKSMLSVAEVTEEAADYESYKKQTADALNGVTDNLQYIKLLDISIINANGEKVIPAAAVDVNIRLLDKSEVSENTQIVHFGEKVEVLESSVEDDAVTFSTEGFSIFVIVDISNLPDNNITQTFENDKFIITASYTEKAEIPSDAIFKVSEVFLKSDSDHYVDRVDQLNGLFSENQYVCKELLNIGFWSNEKKASELSVNGSDLSEIEPADTVLVAIQFKDTTKYSEGDALSIIHFGEEGPEIVGESALDEENSLSFEVESFSDFAVVGENREIEYISPISDTAEIHKEGSVTGFLSNLPYGTIYIDYNLMDFSKYSFATSGSSVTGTSTNNPDVSVSIEIKSSNYTAGRGTNGRYGICYSQPTLQAGETVKTEGTFAIITYKNVATLSTGEKANVIVTLSDGYIENTNPNVSQNIGNPVYYGNGLLPSAMSKGFRTAGQFTINIKVTANENDSISGKTFLFGINDYDIGSVVYIKDTYALSSLNGELIGIKIKDGGGSADISGFGRITFPENGVGTYQHASGESHNIRRFFSIPVENEEVIPLYEEDGTTPVLENGEQAIAKYKTACYDNTTGEFLFWLLTQDEVISEQTEILNGRLSKIYVSDESTLFAENTSNGAVRLSGTRATGGSETTQEDYDDMMRSGYFVVADAENGLTFRARCSAGANTHLTNSNMIYRIYSRTYEGGTISTSDTDVWGNQTAYGVHQPEGATGYKRYKEALLAVPKNKTAVYTMTPDTFWHIWKVKISDGTEDNTSGEIDLRNATWTDGSYTHHGANETDYTFTKDANGVISYTFTGVSEDHYITVWWEKDPPQQTVTIIKKWYDEGNARLSRPDDITVHLVRSDDGRVNPDSDETAKTKLVTGTDQNISGSTQWVKNDTANQWEYTFAVATLPEGVSFKAYEDQVSDYTGDAVGNQNANTATEIGFNEDTNTHQYEVVITNTRKNGTLSFSKTDQYGFPVEGASFRLYNDADCTQPPAAVYTATSDSTGTVTFSDVPCGMYYMKETNIPTYGEGSKPYTDNRRQVYQVVIHENSEGSTIMPGTVANHVFTPSDNPVSAIINTKPEGQVTITKIVDGDATAQAQRFVFVMEFLANMAEKTIRINGSDATLGTAVGGKVLYEFTLSHNKSITFSALPDDMSYKVEEHENAEFKTSVSITPQPAEGSFVIGEEGNDAYVSGTIDADKAYTISYTNKKLNEDENFIIVEKKFEGITPDQIPDNFTITVTGGDVRYTLTKNLNTTNIKFSISEDGLTWKWTIFGAAAGIYTVSESNQTIDNYDVTTVPADAASEGGHSAQTVAPDFSVSGSERIDSCNNKTFKVGDNFIFIASLTGQGNSGVIVVSQYALSAAQRIAIKKWAQQNGGTGNFRTEDYRFFSTEQQGDEFYVGNATVTYDSHAKTVHFAGTNNWQHVLKGTISKIPGENPDIKITNTYARDNPPGGGGNPPGGGRRRRVTPPPTVPTTPGEVLGATRDVGRGVLGAVREPQVLGAVRTGDTNALIIWATILILAVSGFAGWISIYHRKKSTRLR